MVRTMKDMADLFFLHHNLFHRGIIQGILMLMIITIMMFKIMFIITTWHHLTPAMHHLHLAYIFKLEELPGLERRDPIVASLWFL